MSVAHSINSHFKVKNGLRSQKRGDGMNWEVYSYDFVVLENFYIP